MIKPNRPDAAAEALSAELDALAPGWQRLPIAASAFAHPQPWSDAGWQPTVPHLRPKTLAAPKEINWRSKQAIFTPEDQAGFNTATSFALISVMADMGLIRKCPQQPLSAGYLHWCLAELEGEDSLDPAVAVDLLLVNSVPEYRKGDYPFPKERCAGAHGVTRLAEARPLLTEDDARRALQRGPVFAVMDLWDDFWRFYRSGIYRHAAGSYLGPHGVAVVGFDDTDGCWIVRNSRGIHWGDQGYAYVAFGECRMFTRGGHGGMQLILA